jgi:hypothetical protein
MVELVSVDARRGAVVAFNAALATLTSLSGFPASPRTAPAPFGVATDALGAVMAGGNEAGGHGLVGVAGIALDPAPNRGTTRAQLASSTLGSVNRSRSSIGRSALAAQTSFRAPLVAARRDMVPPARAAGPAAAHPRSAAPDLPDLLLLPVVAARRRCRRSPSGQRHEGRGRIVDFRFDQSSFEFIH